MHRAEPEGVDVGVDKGLDDVRRRHALWAKVMLEQMAVDAHTPLAREVEFRRGQDPGHEVLGGVDAAEHKGATCGRRPRAVQAIVFVDEAISRNHLPRHNPGGVLQRRPRDRDGRVGVPPQQRDRPQALPVHVPRRAAVVVRARCHKTEQREQRAEAADADAALDLLPRPPGPLVQLAGGEGGEAGRKLGEPCGRASSPPEAEDGQSIQDGKGGQPHARFDEVHTPHADNCRHEDVRRTEEHDALLGPERNTSPTRQQRGAAGNLPWPRLRGARPTQSGQTDGKQDREQAHEECHFALPRRGYVAKSFKKACSGKPWHHPKPRVAHCQVTRRLPEGILLRGSRTELHERHNRVFASLHRGVVEGGAAVVVHSVDGRAILDEDLHAVRTSRLRSEHGRRATLVVDGIDVCSAGQ
mmetsp:Transcript_84059/g.271739  ORF Transcript_84059/g.271739 Transcript_84059/m.271739 type:complete len:413 (-) Transcript_84059:1167-2405(-)